MMAKKLIITRCADCMYYMDGGGEMDVCDRMDKVMHIEPYTAIDPRCPLPDADTTEG